MSLSVETGTPDGVRLLSHRPSVLFKIEHHGDEAAEDVSASGVLISGPGWGERLKAALAALSQSERASLFALRLPADGQELPLPAVTLLGRVRSDWFPKFLSQGQMAPVYQPLVDLRDPRVFAREALMRGRMGKMELRGSELVEAAEVHDALYSFDLRARVAALEGGLPRLPDGEILLVNLDPRAVIDVDGSLRSVWPVVERAGGRPDRVGLEFIRPERFPDVSLLKALVAAHREAGAVIGVDNLCGGGESIAAVEELRPDLAKLDRALCKGIETSPARRRLVGALVEVAHELGCKVVAVGIERDTELEAVIELGIDYGQGFLIAQPTEEMLPVDTRLITLDKPA